MNDLKQEIINLKNIKERLDFKKEEIKEIQKAYDKLRLETIPNMMDDSGIEKLSLEGVGTLYLTSDVYTSIPAQTRPEAWEWLSDHGHGDLITQTVNSSTLKAFVKQAISNGEELPEGLFKVTPFSRASIRKS